MSAFEIAHLKQCYKRADIRANRLQIIILVLRKIYYERSIIQKHGDPYDAWSEQIGTLNMHFHDFETFMKTIPDILIPTHPDRMHADKYYKEFSIFHAAWRSADNDITFSEFLQLKSQQHDIEH